MSDSRTIKVLLRFSLAPSLWLIKARPGRLAQGPGEGFGAGIIAGLCLVIIGYWLMGRLPALWRLAVALIMFLASSVLPWLILVLAVFIVVLPPALNWYNRPTGIAAAEMALALSNNPQAFVRLMTELTDQNLTQAEPGRSAKLLFYDHATYNGRVKLAGNYRSLPKSLRWQETKILSLIKSGVGFRIWNLCARFCAMIYAVNHVFVMASEAS